VSAEPTRDERGSTYFLSIETFDDMKAVLLQLHPELVAIRRNLDDVKDDVKALRDEVADSKRSSTAHILTTCITAFSTSFAKYPKATLALVAMLVTALGIVVAGVSGTSLSGLLGEEVIEAGAGAVEHNLPGPPRSDDGAGQVDSGEGRPE